MKRVRSRLLSLIVWACLSTAFASADTPTEIAQQTTRTTNIDRIAFDPLSVAQNVSGQVVDAKTGQPIKDVTVTIERKRAVREDDSEPSLIDVVELNTNADGEWTMTLSPELLIEPWLYLSAWFTHPQYEPIHDGYPIDWLGRDLRRGKANHLKRQRMSFARTVKGQLVTSDGDVLPHTSIQFSTSNGKDSSINIETETDGDGCFELQVGEGRNAAVSFIPAGHCPVRVLLEHNQRDLGQVIVDIDSGCTIEGRVTDSSGEPVEGVHLYGRTDYSRSSTVGKALKKRGLRTTIAYRWDVTDGDGRYKVGPLPAGECYVEVRGRVRPGMPTNGFRTDHSEPTLGLLSFQRNQSFDITKSDRVLICDIEAVPNRAIHCQIVDSRGKPVRNRAFAVQGDRESNRWHHSESNPPDSDGRFDLFTPLDLRNAEVFPKTSDTYSWRFSFSPSGRLMHGRSIYLENMTDEDETLFFIRYAAPTLFVVPVDANGDLLDDVTIASEYAADPHRDENGDTRLAKTGSVQFDLLGDGRFRSRQLLPDEETTVTVTKNGYRPATAIVTLGEGEKRGVILELRRKPD